MSMEWIDYIITKNGTYVGADEAEATIATLRSAIAASETIHHGDILHLEKLINEAEAECEKLRDDIELRDTLMVELHEELDRLTARAVKDAATIELLRETIERETLGRIKAERDRDEALVKLARLQPGQCSHGKPLDKPCPECDPRNPLYALGVKKTV